VRRRLRQFGIRRRHWAASAPRPVSGWDSLTSTEQAVAGLVAEGLSNGQVAARMYISPHTVAHHLRQTFRKLSKMGIVASGASFRIFCEHALPAAQRAALCRSQRGGARRTTSDLECHQPVAPGLTMMQPVLLRLMTT
jgi:DNA-binding CsgD family transcriptional regulator